MKRFAVPDALAKEVCNRLGTALPSTPDDVDALYHAWCAQVPFDGVAKAIARQEDRDPPGADPAAFCEQWLATGLGGLCWPHVSGLAAILASAGVECSFGLDRMLIDRVDLHAFLVLRDRGPADAVDVVHPAGGRLPIVDGATGVHPVYGAGFLQDEERFVHWYENPEGDRKRVTYAVLSTTLDAEDVVSFAAMSRHVGMRVRRFYQRRLGADWISHARPAPDGRSLLIIRWDAAGRRESVHDPREGLAAIGYGPEAVRLIERSGFLVRGDEGWNFTV